MIIVFGSLNADLTLRVSQLPGPGETCLCPGYILGPGGKGANQAIAAARAGAHVRMVGCIGRDAFAQPVRQALTAAGIGDADLRPSSEPTGCAVIMVNEHGENVIVVASGANLQARADDVQDSWLTPDAHILCQMEITPDEVWALLGRAQARGCKTILNLAPYTCIPSSTLAHLDYLMMNGPETAAFFQSENWHDAAQSFVREHDITLVVTRGADGADAITPRQSHHVAAHPVDVVDSTGAGDAFVGAFAAALDRGDNLHEALRAAALAGALACTTVGAQASAAAQ